MEPNLDRAVIPRSPGSVPRFADFERDLLAPAGLLAGERLGIVEVLGWSSIGDLHKMDALFAGEQLDFAVLVKPRDPDADTFLRTRLWNISYQGQDFDRRGQALLAEVAKRLDAVADTLQLDPAALHHAYFRRPERDDYLEITPGRKLYLRITDHCDENCLFCNATEGNANIVNSRSDLRDIVDRLPVGALIQVIFSGGEPTLVRALPDYVAIAYEAGAREIRVQTNGVNFAKAGALEPYLPFRDRLGIGFSLHASDPRLSDRLTGAASVPPMPLGARFSAGLVAKDLPDAPLTGRFQTKLAAIDRSVELGFRVKITCVVMAPNIAQVPEFARWCWDRWGARLDRLQFSYGMPRGNAWLNRSMLLKFSACVRPFEDAFAFGRETGMHIEASQTSMPPPCVMPDSIAHFDLYGDFGGTVADSERVKPAELCAGCVMDRICPGIWTRYIELHGTDEFGAITDRPAPLVNLADDTDGEILDLLPSEG